MHDLQSGLRNRIWEMKALKNLFYFKNEEIGIYFRNPLNLSQLKALWEKTFNLMDIFFFFF